MFLQFVIPSFKYFKIIQAARLNPERSIPHSILKGARGLAIITIAKVGALLTYKFGTGLVIARRFDGSWSAPSAITSVGLGWGVQVFSFYNYPSFKGIHV